MIKKKKIEADLTNLKSETTTNQEQGKKNRSRYDPWLHALRSKEEEQRWQCGGANAISPFLSMRICVCLKIMTPKGQQDYVRRITERAREFMESSRKKKKGVENERARERKREGGSRIKWKVKKKKRRGLESCGYMCMVDKM